MASSCLLPFLAVIAVYSALCLGLDNIPFNSGSIGGGGIGPIGGGVGGPIGGGVSVPIGGGTGGSFGSGGSFGPFGRIWCTCRSWCRFGEFTISNTCRLPFFPWHYNTCCKNLPWWLTRLTGGYSGSGGYPGYGGSGGYPGWSGSGGYPGWSGSGGYPGWSGSGGYPSYGPYAPGSSSGKLH